MKPSRLISIGAAGLLCGLIGAACAGLASIVEWLIPVAVLLLFAGGAAFGFAIIRPLEG